MPLLSIVIPTRNRYEYLIASVRVALQNLQDVEVVVCDNSDDNRLESELADFLAEGRVKYHYSRDLLSVVANFELALSIATGEYIIFIGDDDSIGIGLEEIAIWAQREGVDAVVSYRNAFLASYFWPGVKSKYFGDAYSAQLFVNPYSGREGKIDPIQSLNSVAIRLGGGLGDMPRAYHGLISRTLVNRIIERHGHLFGGVSPDIYSATLISANCRRPYIVDYPFVLPGASPSSTAGQGAERSDRGGLRSTEHIARFGAGLKWDPKIPAFYSPHTVWAFSFCKALEEVPNIDIEPKYGRLYASCLLYYRAHWRQTIAAMSALSGEQGIASVVVQTAEGFMTEMAYQIKRIILRLLHPKAGGQAIRYGPEETICDAYNALKQHALTQPSGLELHEISNKPNV